MNNEDEEIYNSWKSRIFIEKNISDDERLALVIKGLKNLITDLDQYTKKIFLKNVQYNPTLALQNKQTLQDIVITSLTLRVSSDNITWRRAFEINRYLVYLYAKYVK